MNNFSFKKKDSLFELNKNNKLTLDSKHKEMVEKFKGHNESNKIKKNIKDMENKSLKMQKYIEYYKNYLDEKGVNVSFNNDKLHSVKSSNFYIKSSSKTDIVNNEIIPELPKYIEKQIEMEKYDDDEEYYVNEDIEELTEKIYKSYGEKDKTLKDLSLPELINVNNKLKNKLKDMKQKLQQLENNEEENNYYLVNGDLIYKYFNKNGTKSAKKSKKTKKSKKKTKRVADNDTKMGKFLKKTENKDLDIEILKREALNTTNADYYETLVSSTLINDEEKDLSEWVKKKEGFNKADMYGKFMSNVDNKFNLKPLMDKNYNKCSKCGSQNLKINSYECFYTCNNCGIMEHMFIDTDKRSYKEPPPENSYFAYKRINHFREWLAQFQAKESTDIPEHVYKVIIMEIQKNRIKDIQKLTIDKVRDFLKKHGLNKYYEHTQHIIYKLNGKKPPVISKEMEEKLCTLFKDIQSPFNKVKPAERKNFLSYAFVIYKFCQLLELDDLAENFTLLKNKEKLNQQEDIWKKICKELKWEYIPTAI